MKTVYSTSKVRRGCHPKVIGSSSASPAFIPSPLDAPGEPYHLHGPPPPRWKQGEVAQVLPPDGTAAGVGATMLSSSLSSVV